MADLLQVDMNVLLKRRGRPLVNNDREATAYLEGAAFDEPENARAVFLSQNATREDVETAVTISKRFAQQACEDT